MPLTAFDPSRHGLHFINTFETNLVADWRFGGLCGGMSYAALDYFTNNRAAPSDRERPPDGSALFNYIYQRQVQSIVPNLDKWGELLWNPFGSLTDSFFRWGLDKSDGGRIGELRATVGLGYPAPLGLFREGGGGLGVEHHQVLAIGYDGTDKGQPDDAIRIKIYDPNHPDEVRALRPDLATRRWVIDGGAPDERWITYFVDRKYTPQQPPQTAATPPQGPARVTTLQVAITTGSDDLRGGNDNLDIAVLRRSGPETVFGNVNGFARWIDNYKQTVALPLNPPPARSEIACIELRTHFRGGFGGDNWNVNAITVTDDRGNQLVSRAGNPLIRFTGDIHTYRVDIPA